MSSCAIGLAKGFEWTVPTASVFAVACLTRGLRRRTSREQSARWSATTIGAVKSPSIESSRLKASAFERSEPQTSNFADLASEIAALESEAARLRARAAELEGAKAAAELAERRQLLAEFDVDRSGGVDAAEIQRGMNKYFAVELTESDSNYILTEFDKNSTGELELAEFDVKRFLFAIERKWAEDFVKQKEEVGRVPQAEERSAMGHQETLPGENQEDGILVRLGCVLAYLLPVLDGILYGLPLCIFVPQLIPVMAPFFWLLDRLETIPLGSLIWFFILQYLSRQQWVPALLRYNLCQAVDLDIRICFFSLFLQLSPMIAGAFVPFTEETINEGIITTSPTPVAILWICLRLLLSILVFLPFIASIIYLITSSLLGYVPHSIPMVSQEADRIMRLQPPASKEKGDDDSRV